MNICREDVYKVLARSFVSINNVKIIKEMLEDWIGDEYAENFFDDLDYSDIEALEVFVVKSLTYKCSAYSNCYLASIYETLTNSNNCEVTGTVEKRYSCLVCNFKTLDEIADYDICEYCGWEDEPLLRKKGINNNTINTYISINRGSVQDYRNKLKNRNKYYTEKWLKD